MCINQLVYGILQILPQFHLRILIHWFNLDIFFAFTNMIYQFISIQWMYLLIITKTYKAWKWDSLQNFHEFLNSTSVCRTQSFNGNLSKLKIPKQAKEGRTSTHCVQWPDLFGNNVVGSITPKPPKIKVSKESFEKNSFFLKTLLKTLLLPCLKWCKK